MLIEQITEFRLRVPEPHGLTCTHKKMFNFMTKQKNPKQTFEWLFTGKNIAGGIVSCFSHLGQVTYNI